MYVFQVISCYSWNFACLLAFQFIDELAFVAIWNGKVKRVCVREKAGQVTQLVLQYVHVSTYNKRVTCIYCFINSDSWDRNLAWLNTISFVPSERETSILLQSKEKVCWMRCKVNRRDDFRHGLLWYWINYLRKNYTYVYCIRNTRTQRISLCSIGKMHVQIIPNALLSLAQIMYIHFKSMNDDDISQVQILNFAHMQRDSRILLVMVSHWRGIY